MPPKTLRAGIYARVSTNGEESPLVAMGRVKRI